MADLLAAAIGIDERDPATIGAAYDFAAVTREERDREAARLGTRQRYESALVTGPILTLTQLNLQQSFDPSNLVPLDSLGTVYPTGSFAAEWGTLEVTAASRGALVSPDYARLALSAAELRESGGIVRGEGWSLRLAERFALVAANRPGSFEVRRRTP